MRKTLPAFRVIREEIEFFEIETNHTSKNMIMADHKGRQAMYVLEVYRATVPQRGMDIIANCYIYLEARFSERLMDEIKKSESLLALIFSYSERSITSSESDFQDMDELFLGASKYTRNRTYKGISADFRYGMICR